MTDIYHPVRMKIVHYLLTHSTMTYAELAKALGENKANILHHCRVLTDYNVLEEVRRNTFRLREKKLPRSAYFFMSALILCGAIVGSLLLSNIGMFVLFAASYVAVTLTGISYWTLRDTRSVAYAILSRVERQ